MVERHARCCRHLHSCTCESVTQEGEFNALLLLVKGTDERKLLDLIRVDLTIVLAAYILSSHSMLKDGKSRGWPADFSS